MIHVTGKATEVKVAFTPDQSAVYTASSIPWDNPSLMKALRQLFVTGRNEAITSISVSQFGIKAHFKKMG